MTPNTSDDARSVAVCLDLQTAIDNSIISIVLAAGKILRHRNYTVRVDTSIVGERGHFYRECLTNLCADTQPCSQHTQTFASDDKITSFGGCHH